MCPSFVTVNELARFYETWVRCYVFGGHRKQYEFTDYHEGHYPSRVLFNFLWSFEFVYNEFKIDRHSVYIGLQISIRALLSRYILCSILHCQFSAHVLFT
jgi:hypothetical protein